MILELFCILLVMVITRIHACVKTHRTVYQKEDREEEKEEKVGEGEGGRRMSLLCAYF